MQTFELTLTSRWFLFSLVQRMWCPERISDFDSSNPKLSTLPQPILTTSGPEKRADGGIHLSIWQRLNLHLCELCPQTVISGSVHESCSFLMKGHLRAQTSRAPYFKFWPWFCTQRFLQILGTFWCFYVIFVKVLKFYVKEYYPEIVPQFVDALFCILVNLCLSSTQLCYRVWEIYLISCKMLLQL